MAYLDPLRVVGATAADAPHRIYLGSGIYGEVVMQWREGGGFEAASWMRPESLPLTVLKFMNRVRASGY